MSALAGLRVLDLTRFWAGPALTEVLADMGAEVIKVEAIQSLDMWRTGGARMVLDEQEDVPLYEACSIFNAVNRNKLGITLDLTRPAGQDLFKRLVVHCDVVAENFTPRVMPKFGLDYAALSALREDLIMVALPGFGSTGPWAHFSAFAFPTEQMSGFPALTGYAGGRPMCWGNAGADAIAGMVGAFAVLAALEHRRRTGEGQFIDVSQAEALAAFLGQQAIDHSWNGRDWPRRGNRDPHMAPHGIFPCREPDTWIAIAAQDDDEWRALAGVLERADLAQETLAQRQAHEDELEALVSAWTSTQDRFAAMEHLQAQGVAAGAVLGGADLLENPQLTARGYWHWIERRHMGCFPIHAMWAQFSATPAEIRRPAPLLGEHNAEVLGGLLGLDDAELERLAADGIIGTVPLVAPR